MAEIIVHRRDVTLGRFFYEYEWQGSVYEHVFIRGEDVSKLPWPMKLLSIEANGDKYIRTDTRWWWVTYAKIKSTHFFMVFNSRLMMTAHIWRLVDVYQSEIPSWKIAFKRRWKK